jgi:8-oxo-dGTP diphosphatase
MLRKLIGFVWGKTPYFLRLLMIRSTQDKFTVSVAAIITNEKREILILNHVLRPYSNWGIPGGFIEADEPPEVAVRREIREETGIELENVKLIQIRTVKRHVEILYRAEGIGTPQVKSREINAAEWFALDTIPQDMSDIQKSMLQQVLNKEI